MTTTTSATTRSSTRPTAHLTTRQRLLIGGIGALSPQLANLLIVDLEQVITGATPMGLLVYVIRGCALAAIGVLIAYLHDDESNKAKVFQFGLAAPAMLLATINGRELALRGRPAHEGVPGVVSPAVVEDGSTESGSVDMVPGVWAMSAVSVTTHEAPMACTAPPVFDELVLAAPPSDRPLWPVQSAATAE